MGAEIAQELERLEMSFVHIYQRMTYACRSCAAGVTTTPGPDRAFSKGILGTGFLSYLINERFGNYMPYYRIEKKHAKEGVDVSRSVRQRSVARCAEKLRPLYDLLCSKVRAAEIFFEEHAAPLLQELRARLFGLDCRRARRVRPSRTR